MWKKRKFISLCCFEVQQTNVLLLYFRFHCIQDWVCWVSVWKNWFVSFVSKKRKFDSLCCFELQQTNVLLLYLRFYSKRDLIRWVSVWKSWTASFMWKRTHCVVSKCSREMFCSFFSDFIVLEIECVECLCKKVDLCLLCRRGENSTHCVISKRSRQMFCFLMSDSIPAEIECVEFLCVKAVRYVYIV